MVIASQWCEARCHLAFNMTAYLLWAITAAAFRADAAAELRSEKENVTW